MEALSPVAFCLLMLGPLRDDVRAFVPCKTWSLFLLGDGLEYLLWGQTGALPGSQPTYSPNLSSWGRTPEYISLEGNKQKV